MRKQLREHGDVQVNLCETVPFQVVLQCVERVSSSGCEQHVKEALSADIFYVLHAACIRKARSGSSGKLQPSPLDVVWIGC